MNTGRYQHRVVPLQLFHPESNSERVGKMEIHARVDKSLVCADALMLNFKRSVVALMS